MGRPLLRVLKQLALAAMQHLLLRFYIHYKAIRFQSNMCSSFPHSPIKNGSECVPNLNVLPVCLPFPKTRKVKKLRQNVVKVIKGKALLLFLKRKYILNLVFVLALLENGLPKMSFVCFRAEKEGWMAVFDIRFSLSVKCKNQIFLK